MLTIYILISTHKEDIWTNRNISILRKCLFDEIIHDISTVRGAKFISDYTLNILSFTTLVFSKIAKFSTREIQNKFYLANFKFLRFYTHLQSELYPRLHSITTAQRMKFSIKSFFSKCDQIRIHIRTEYGDIRSISSYSVRIRDGNLVAFTEKTFNGKLHFLCLVHW